jgi:hypothetical protein
MVGLFLAVVGSILLSIGIGSLMDIDMASSKSAFPFLMEIIMIFVILACGESSFWVEFLEQSYV